MKINNYIPITLRYSQYKNIKAAKPKLILLNNLITELAFRAEPIPPDKIRSVIDWKYFC